MFTLLEGYNLYQLIKIYHVLTCLFRLIVLYMECFIILCASANSQTSRIFQPRCWFFQSCSVSNIWKLCRVQSVSHRDQQMQTAEYKASNLFHLLGKLERSAASAGAGDPRSHSPCCNASEMGHDRKQSSVITSGDFNISTDDKEHGNSIGSFRGA